MRSMRRLVVLKLNGDLESQGFNVTLEIGPEYLRPEVEITAYLPPNPELATHLQDHWLKQYRSLGTPYSTKFIKALDLSSHPSQQRQEESPHRELICRIKPKAIKYNASVKSWVAECRKSGEKLRDRLQTWLESEQFRPLDKRLREELDRDESIRFLIRTENASLQKLPWHLWDVFERYPQAEVALSHLQVEKIQQLKVANSTATVKILAILGHSQGIDIERDKQLLERLPNSEIVFLVEPERQEVHKKLWEQPWDIIFFAGHSETDGEIGRIYINQTESLTIDELWYALKKAVERGLQLAIFNSCDGLALARRLDDLQIPQMIVMRELVPDEVAQEFLKRFLRAFAGGQPLYSAVREAREWLQGLENQFPCASWLPVIWQNPACLPPTWNDLLSNQCSEAETSSLLEKLENLTQEKFSSISAPVGFMAHKKYPLGTLPQKFRYWILLLLGVGAIGWQLAAPPLAKSLNNVALVDYQAGRLNQAMELTQVALLFNPDNRAAIYNLAWRCERLQKFDCAFHNYQRAAELGNGSAYIRLAVLSLSNNHDSSAATRWLLAGQKFLQPDPPVLYAWSATLGWARLEQGRYAEAETALKDAIAIDSSRGYAHCLLAELQERQNNRKESLEHSKFCVNYAEQERLEEDAWRGRARQRLQAGRDKYQTP